MTCSKPTLTEEPEAVQQFMAYSAYSCNTYIVFRTCGALLGLARSLLLLSTLGHACNGNSTTPQHACKNESSIHVLSNYICTRDSLANLPKNNKKKDQETNTTTKNLFHNPPPAQPQPFECQNATQQKHQHSSPVTQREIDGRVPYDRSYRLIS